jgi:hypothetical protein
MAGVMLSLFPKTNRQREGGLDVGASARHPIRPSGGSAYGLRADRRRSDVTPCWTARR